MSGLMVAKIVRSDDCAVCIAANNIGHASDAVHLVGALVPVEIARTHFIVAYIIGVRRDVLEVCSACKGIIDRASAQIEANGGRGRVIL